MVERSHTSLLTSPFPVRRSVKNRLILPDATALLLAGVCMLSATGADVADPFMGDWKGKVQVAGREQPIAAQVLALGHGTYRAQFCHVLYNGEKPLLVLDGKRHGDSVLFGHDARISNNLFTGNHATLGGAFELQKTVILSPTLGQKPPPGSVVLFDGTSLAEWEQPGNVYGRIDLNRTLGRSQNAVAYLRNALHTSAAQDVVLLVGSDDGVRVWVNGALVHDANVFRPLAADQDRVRVSLKKGWNDVLLKVSQGGGDWAARVRVVCPDGKPADGVSVRYAPDGTPKTEADGFVLPRDGVILCWQIAGPFKSPGTPLDHLLPTPFPPETAPESVHWKRVVSTKLTPGVGWKLTGDGAMEVVPGTGNVFSRRKFRDFFLHIEFRTPFMPEARGQARGNSGVYLQARYEIQVLDSYGLEGKDNECGGIYKIAAPRINMCAPPLQWQTYDVDFRAARYDANGRKVRDAVVTVRHNGVVIHRDQPLPHPTGGGRGESADPGPLMLQDHHCRVRYRNIWVVPK